jgi:hypothetical protein
MRSQTQGERPDFRTLSMDIMLASSRPSKRAGAKAAPFGLR